jgi:predicted transcriptional regulator
MTLALWIKQKELTVTEFARKAKLARSHVYSIFEGKKVGKKAINNVSNATNGEVDLRKKPTVISSKEANPNANNILS